MRRAIAGIVLCAAAWSVALATWSTSPAMYDFLALYSSARLVALGRPADVTDRHAIQLIEHETRPERTAFLNNPNPPVVSLLLAPLGFLPFEIAYATWLTVLVGALYAAALLLGRLASQTQRRRLLPFALLAPPSLISLIHGQTTPLILLAVAASLFTPPRWSGLLLAVTAMRPQFFPLFAVVALLDKDRRWPFIAGAAAVALSSLALVGLGAIPGYIDLVTYSAAELRPVDLGVASLLRRFGAGEDAVVSLGVSAVAMLAAAVALVRSRKDEHVVRAGAWSLFAAPHALPHDGILAYPVVALHARATLPTLAWVVSGTLVAIIHQAGVPVGALWLLAAAAWPRKPDAGA